MDQNGVAKGTVTAWRIDRINKFNYDVHYKPGKYNTTRQTLCPDTQ